MSEDVYYTGKLIPTGKTLKEFDPDADDIYDRYREAVEIDGEVYLVNMKNVDAHSNIFEASKNSDGSINFTIKYYNGGCGFNEAIDYALENMEEKSSL